MEQKYDFAFSFAGEDRNLVERIRNGLTGFTVFYDKDYQAELCGKDLYQYLRNLYMNQARYVVCFISKHYKNKIWTNVEFSAIKERLMATFFASDFLIPIIVDEDTTLQDIPSFIGFYQHKSIEETISILKAKYNHVNEDFYTENINHFKEYILQEIAFCLEELPIQIKENTITLFLDSVKRTFTLSVEDFSKLPCLLVYEDEDLKNPTAIITWKRSENILFTLNCFSNMGKNSATDISLNDLIQKLKQYMLSRR